MGMTHSELVDEMEWKANLERINKKWQRFHMKSKLMPAPWIVRKEYMDRIGVQTMKDHVTLDSQMKMLRDSDYWE